MDLLPPATAAPWATKPPVPPAGPVKLALLPGGLDLLRQTAASSAPPQHAFLRPAKRIFEGSDVAHFLVSQAYRDIGLFILQLNHAVCPRTTAAPGTLPTASTTTLFTLDAPRADPPSVRRLQQLLARVEALIDEAPPDPGPRRFGNVSFRVWHRLLGERVAGWLRAFVLGEEETKTETEIRDDTDTATALDEITAYFLGSFGSAQRLDYGTGHELSFLAFLGCLWKLGVFADGTTDNNSDGEAVERSLVLGVLEPYLAVVRRLILVYTLEPAGSHGVWGLDDHSFLPYIFGSAQLARPLTAAAQAVPQEGSAPRAPKPADVLRPAAVAVQRTRNLYFSAIGFIDDVKRGPFWEHSPILFDVSGIPDGWGKINKGMLKMYNAEVLSKFPVVQHFPFGSLFSWDPDPDADAPTPSVHLASQPATTPMPPPPPSTTATAALPQTGAPWAQVTRMPGTAPGSLPGPGIPYSRVPTFRPPGPSTRPPHPSTSGAEEGGSTAAQVGLTKAPWAQ